jgi:anti-sigma factor RsiW
MADKKTLTDEDRAEIVAYLDGELDERRARALEARINTDPAVRAEADVLRKTYDLLDYLPRPEPSPNFTHRTIDRLGTVAPTKSVQPVGVPRPSRWGVRFLGAAALVAASVIGWAVAPALPWLPRPKADNVTDLDRQLEKDLSLIEHWREYRHATDAQMATELDRPELFGDEHLGY